MTLESVKRYLERLPHGLASYPASCVKGTVVRAVALAFQSDAELRAGLPPETDRLLAEPPLASAWIPEVHLNVLFSAICETRYPVAGAFETWAYEGNRTILGGPVYRVLFGVLGPERIMIGLPNRWSAFRRGTTLVPLEVEPKRARTRLTYEPWLMPDVGLLAMRAAVRAAADVSGARSVTVTYEEESPTSTVFSARWV